MLAEVRKEVGLLAEFLQEFRKVLTQVDPEEDKEAAYRGRPGLIGHTFFLVS